ncbi:ABC transporter permease [Sphingomonas sp. CROZ-RG-20F-R02-07]|uniref:ABC transporter permease n=1 Tax=Sphingomonas sp. CROZ-RG-20F-R02-07 TaxID=2914832 RepID=UPI001F57408F|nr:ABC transporter permease [Sphingomonas sp. CROZ-RG-20F-R02-07]
MGGHIVYDDRRTLVRPRHFLRLALADLIYSLPVAWHLFRSRLRSRNRRLWLGYLWLLLPSLGSVAVCLVVQSQKVVTIAPTVLPYGIFVMAGTMLWQAFVEALNTPLQQLNTHRQMLTRTRVPLEGFIGAGVLELLLNCAIRLAFLCVTMLVVGMAMPVTMLLVPFGVLALTLLGLAIGLLLSPFGLLYDDVGQGLALGVTFWFFLTPVVYPASHGGILSLNPVAPLIVTTRSWLTGPADPLAFIACTLGAGVLLAIAWLLARVARPHVAARLG